MLSIAVNYEGELSKATLPSGERHQAIDLLEGPQNEHQSVHNASARPEYLHSST